MIIVLNWETHLFVSMLCIQCIGGITVIPFQVKHNFKFFLLNKSTQMYPAASLSGWNAS